MNFDPTKQYGCVACWRKRRERRRKERAVRHLFATFVPAEYKAAGVWFYRQGNLRARDPLLRLSRLGWKIGPVLGVH